MSKTTTEVDLSGFGFERLQHIGRGQYANAQLVRETATGAIHVAKCISLAALNEHDQDLANQEVYLLQNLAHPYIVGYRDSFLIEGGSNTLVIVMEHCDGGDLRKSIKEKAHKGEHFSEDQIMNWFVQLCLALQYVHSEKVLHRDLKTSNIFLANDGGTIIKLGDFGISRVLEGTTEAAVTIVGTPYYMSPEVCRSEPYSWKSDIWALGCVLYELCMLKHAFESSSLLGLVYKIVSEHYEPIPSFYSTQLNDLIRQLLMKSAESRPSINELFANPYVKGYLAKQASPMASPAPPAPPPPAEAPPAAAGGKRAPTLRPVRSGTLSSGAPPPPPPPPPGPPVLSPNANVSIVAARIRRRLVGQKLNWISSFASFDDSGEGALSADVMRLALTSMGLGLSEDEMLMLTTYLSPAPGAKISLDSFGSLLMNACPEVLQCETWARQIFAPAGRNLRDVLQASDTDRCGTLPMSVFKQVVSGLAPVVTPSQLDVIGMLADKNCNGDVDYAEFVNAFGAPLAPQAPPPGGAPSPSGMPAAPPGMPPLPGMGGPAAAPRGMPPLPSPPGAMSPAAPTSAPDPLAMSLSLGNITFFTCQSVQLQGMTNAQGAAGTAVRMLSAEGCALIFSRLKRRLEAAGLTISEAFVLFAAPGERELASEQWLEAASRLPLGASRAEMQQLFSKVDTANAGKVSLEALEGLISRVSAADCTISPPWISAAMQRGLGYRIRDALKGCGNVDGLFLARESDFRRVVMGSERYLTSAQLTSLLLLADKDASGHIDYEEFAVRFGGAAPTSGVLQPPGGAAIAPGGGVSAAPPAGFAPPTEEELEAVGSRTGAVLDRYGFSPERLPALMALWGGELPLDLAGAVLAALPLGISRVEAVSLLQANGSVVGVSRQIAALWSRGAWRGHCEWAASCIQGSALRSSLQKMVIEAEIRTLDPSDFAQALLDAGVAAGSTRHAIWLAEKTAQGEVCVAEFLANFGGPPPQQRVGKKKRGMWDRIMGR
eukprot:TRINITY_DN22923_c0_g1_i1.p1 TRINITY_DN22923_c0_g1~~TRINITY_DN22923_c0_g1_i1.p1  ORF type:complete len:999 (+),score=238.40 TRINITY_DN22923_c0_g1_i1:157-3153(+)